jgi:hypothetical protein
MSGGPMPPIIHTKRHIAAGPYQNDRRTQQQQQQQHEHPANNDSNNNNNNNNNSNTNHSNTNNGYHGRGWKRPCMFFFIRINIVFLFYKIKGKNLMDQHQQHSKYVKSQLNIILFQN